MKRYLIALALVGGLTGVAYASVEVVTNPNTTVTVRPTVVQSGPLKVEPANGTMVNPQPAGIGTAAVKYGR